MPADIHIKKHTIAFTNIPPDIAEPWDSAVWKAAPALQVSCYRQEGSNHHPHTQCKLLYDRENIYGIFRVSDRHVRCIHTGFQSAVYKDSCVEFFLQPKNAGGYFNFEFNCGGALLASYVTDPTRTSGTVRGFIPLTPDEDLQIKRSSNLPRIIEPEITGHIIWYLEFSIPFAVLEKYAGVLTGISGEIWRANFYKCGNDTSHPHWGSWSPLSELNFHLPAEFGIIRFAYP